MLIMINERNSPYMYCSQCGTILNVNASFCQSCGQAVGLAPTVAPSSADADQLTELSWYVGRSAGYYIPKWEAMIQRGKNLTWNWPAFLVWPIWFCYRRLYAQLVGILVLQLVVSATLNVFTTSRGASILANLVTPFILVSCP